MAKYIKKFTNHTDYETFINGSDVVLPVVSHCVQEGDVHYNRIEHPLIITYSVNSDAVQNGLKLYNYDNGEDVEYNRHGVDEFESIKFNGTALNISDLDNNNGRYTPSSTGTFVCEFILKDPSTIVSYMFRNCDYIVSVNIPDGVTSIGVRAFQTNNSSILTTVTLPSSVNAIGDYAFCANSLDQASYNAIKAINTNAVVGCGAD